MRSNGGTGLHCSDSKNSRVVRLISLVLVLIIALGGCAGIPRSPLPSGPPTPPLSGPAWFQGDLHAHSLYSDGDSPLTEVLDYAENIGLDFFVVTDHDTSLRGSPEHWESPHYGSTELVLLYGIEWTSKQGHANIFSSTPIDYADIWQANQTLKPLVAAQAAHAQRCLFSVNHPANRFCRWEYDVPDASDVATNTENDIEDPITATAKTFPENASDSTKSQQSAESIPNKAVIGQSTDSNPTRLAEREPLYFDAVEVWNGPWLFPNRSRHAVNDFWDPYLIDGHELPGIGGSDSHQLKGFQKYFNPPGFPTTWVYSQTASPQAILEGIQNGHVSISYRPEADRLDFTADGDGDGTFETIVGQEVPTDRPVTFRVTISPAATFDRLLPNQPEGTKTGPSSFPGAEAAKSGTNATPEWYIGRYAGKIIKNGEKHLSFRLQEGRKPEFIFTDTPQTDDYYRVELRGPLKAGALSKIIFGRLAAMSNPIYAR